MANKKQTKKVCFLHCAGYSSTLELFETMVNNVEMIRSWNISLKELLEKDYSTCAQKVTF